MGIEFESLKEKKSLIDKNLSKYGKIPANKEMIGVNRASQPALL